MKVLLKVLFGFVIASASVANAGTKVLGFELGVTTVEEVKAALQNKARINAISTNRHSGGPQFDTAGNGYQIDGLISVHYIFDAQSKLAAVMLKMNKDRFSSVFSMLANKYPVASQQRPFVGNQFAEFKTQDAIIIVNAPHLSFEMDVDYIRIDLMSRYNANNALDAAAQRRHEASQF